jgi:hypothetical protein
VLQPAAPYIFGCSSSDNAFYSLRGQALVKQPDDAGCIRQQQLSNPDKGLNSDVSDLRRWVQRKIKSGYETSYQYAQNWIPTVKIYWDQFLASGDQVLAKNVQWEIDTPSLPGVMEWCWYCPLVLFLLQVIPLIDCLFGLEIC